MNKCENHLFIDGKYRAIRKAIDCCFLKGQEENIEMLKEFGVEQLIPRSYLDDKLECLGYFVYRRPYDINRMITVGETGEDFNTLGNIYLNFFVENQKKLFTNDFADESVVLYYRGSRFGISPFTHIGVMDKGRVISKFSKHSVFRHPIECVPTVYGNRVVNIKIEGTLERDMWKWSRLRKL